MAKKKTKGTRKGKRVVKKSRGGRLGGTRTTSGGPKKGRKGK